MTLFAAPNASEAGLPKCPTGIRGLDEITYGGLPRGRPTLLCGAAGSGKTLLASEFIVRGATQYEEPGVIVLFEETAPELAANVRSLGFDLEDLVATKRVVIDHVHIEPAEIEETGDYDLDGLFIRLGHAIDSIGARRVVLDTIEMLFAGLSNTGILRAELRRLFRWLKDRGVTAIITAERGDGKLTRQGLEEYVADCVILLDHRTVDQVATRRIQIVKYRGGRHGTNEYPFLIAEDGVDILPITSVGLDHVASTDRVATGISGLDRMLGGRGVYRGSSILVSGAAGTGKSTIAACFVDAACRRGERCVYFAFEESRSQIVRNMRSIGVDLDRWVKAGLLEFHVARPTMHGLETHVATIQKIVRDVAPAVVVMDPITNFLGIGNADRVKKMLTRVVDFLKLCGVTALFTSLRADTVDNDDSGVSSLIDCWILVRNAEYDGDRQRGIYVLKSRGMNHSSRVSRLEITDHGIQITTEETKR